MCLQEIALVILFSITALLIFVFLYGVVYKYQIFCITQQWKNKRNIIYRFILGRFTHILMYILLASFLSFSIVVNLLSLRPYELVLVIITIGLSYLFSQIEIKAIFNNLGSKYAPYVNYIFIYRILLIIVSIIWFAVEYMYFYIEPKKLDDILNLQMKCYLLKNLIIFNELMDYFIFISAVYLKENAILIVKFLYVVFILLKKISFSSAIVLATLGGVYLWEKR
jgi:hypothetical protein